MLPRRPSPRSAYGAAAGSLARRQQRKASRQPHGDLEDRQARIAAVMPAVNLDLGLKPVSCPDRNQLGQAACAFLRPAATQVRQQAPSYRVRKRCDRRPTRCPATRPCVWHSWTAAAARQSVTVGSTHPHPIRKNVGATVAACGQLGGPKSKSLSLSLTHFPITTPPTTSLPDPIHIRLQYIKPTGNVCSLLARGGSASFRHPKIITPNDV